MGDDLGVAGVGRLAAEDHRGPAGAPEDLVQQAELELAVALPAEVGAEVGGPQAPVADLLLERVDDLAAVVVERRVRQVREGQVERLAFVGDERIGPIELFLVFRVSFEVPCHWRIFVHPAGVRRLR